MINQWRAGNQFELLENGEEYFPRVEQAIEQAKTEVLLETFILFEDKVGLALRKALIHAAQRGVQIDVTVDGYGSDTLSDSFIAGLTDSGVRFHVFDPRPRLLGFRTNLFRRLHRKIVAVDGELAFIGGINFSADHLPDSGPEAKQDYSMQVRGPLAADISQYAREALVKARRGRRRWRAGPKELAPEGNAWGRLVVRDNGTHRNDIEAAYRKAIHDARHDVLIANAYFFPGYRLLRALVLACRRGVRVRLILQGRPDMAIARFAASMLYEYLTEAGVCIYEYCDRPLHGKVACVDDAWSTVGSSNLDPLSLSLNLEANVVIQDTAFNAVLRGKLEALIADHCNLAPTPQRLGRRLRRLWLSVVVFHFLRHFPSWAGRLPAHKPRLQSVGNENEPDAREQEVV